MLRQTFATLLGPGKCENPSTPLSPDQRPTLPMVKQPQRLRLALLAAIGFSAIVVFGPGFFHGLSALGGASEEIPVLVAARFIPPFQALKPQQVKVRSFPREYVPPGALHALTEILKDDGQVLYSSIVGIPEGQPLTRTILNETGKDHGMSALLRPGKVAVSFKVEREKSAGGWIHPGDTIAIFQKIPSDGLGHADRRLTRLLLGAVEVLAIDHDHLGHEPLEENKGDGLLQSNLETNEGQVLTVLANTADASALVEAQEAGPLTVVLRPLGDDLPWLQSGGAMR